MNNFFNLLNIPGVSPSIMILISESCSRAPLQKSPVYEKDPPKCVFIMAIVDIQAMVIAPP